MTSYEFGDVVLVPFPFTDQSATKKRPAVIISSSRYNAQRPDVVIMAITSQLKSAKTIGEVTVGDWQVAGLLKPSAIKPVISTLEKGLVIRVMGRLPAADQVAVRESLKVILG